MKSRLIIAIVAFFMAFGVQAQEIDEHMSKKERRQAKKEQKRQEREAYKTEGFKLLKEKNFVLRVDRGSNAKKRKDRASSFNHQLHQDRWRRRHCTVW